MNNLDFAQFKLSNGSEIVCEVMEWPNKDDNQMIVRNAMSIVNIEYEGGDKMYAFRPFVNFLEDETDYIIINSDHIISSNRPREYLIDQYRIAMIDAIQIAKLRTEDYQKSQLEGLQKLSNAMQELMRRKNNPNINEEKEPDKKPISNIIKFPIDDDTIH